MAKRELLSEIALTLCDQAVLRGCGLSVSNGWREKTKRRLRQKWQDLLDVPSGPALWRKAGPTLIANSFAIGALGDVITRAEAIKNSEGTPKSAKDKHLDTAFRVVQQTCHLRLLGRRGKRNDRDIFCPPGKRRRQSRGTRRT
jgi:hypothetical protein